MEKKKFCYKVSLIAVFALVLILGCARTKVYANDVIDATHASIESAFQNTTLKNDMTLADYDRIAQSAVPADALIIADVMEVHTTKATPDQDGKADIYMYYTSEEDTELRIISVTIPKTTDGSGNAADIDNLNKDWANMSAALDKIKPSNKVTKEQLLKKALSAAKYGSTATWKSFYKVDATYDSAGWMQVSLEVSLNGNKRELSYRDEIPMLQRTLPSGATVSKTEWDIIRRTNYYRYKNDRSAILMVEPLQLACQIRAAEESEAEKMDHKRPNGDSCFTAIDTSIFQYSSAGENLYRTGKGNVYGVTALNSWMNSPGHRANILKSGYAYMGAGVDGIQAVQLFAGTKHKIVSYTTSTGKTTFKSVDDMLGEYLICTDDSGLKSYLPLDPSYMTKVKGGYTIKVTSGKTIKIKIKNGTDPVTKFSDVTSKRDKTIVSWVAKNEIMPGVNKKEFGMTLYCTHGDIITALYRANKQPETLAENPYLDLTPDKAYYLPAIWADNVALSTEGFFRGDEYNMKQDVLYLVWKSVGSPRAKKAATFEDVSSQIYYADAVAWAEEKGIIKNKGDHKFHGDELCTRAELAKYIYYAYKSRF